MRRSRSVAQTTCISAGGLVVFNQTDNVLGQEISLNTSTGQITLAAGRTLTVIITDITANKMYRVTWQMTTSSSPYGNYVVIERLI